MTVDRSTAHSAVQSTDESIVCHGCGFVVALDTALPFRCPNAGSGDGADHVLEFSSGLVLSRTATDEQVEEDSDDNPFVRYRKRLFSWRYAMRTGLDDEAYIEAVRALDDRIAKVDGHGFRITPYRWLDALRVYAKDETGNVGGSHKARHLMGLALQIRVAQLAGAVPNDPPRLAIASCGNAALAAAVVARAADWPLSVYIPTDANPRVVERLKDLGADIVVCPRTADLPPGDPCFHRFRQAVDSGALPFCCQGNENGLTIDGGRTLGFELATQHRQLTPEPLGALFVQVGGGALGSAVALGLSESLGDQARPSIVTVQTEGVQPLKRAFNRLRDRSGTPPEIIDYAARHRDAFMTPWPEIKPSLAYGILDDETYDWVALCRAILESGGDTMVVSEDDIAAAQRAISNAGINTCATGAAGYAGVLAARARGFLQDTTTAGVLITGIERGPSQ